MAENELGDSLIGARAVIVGAGQLASGVLRSLRDSKFALGEIIIVNRTLERAEELASGVDDSRVSVTALENIGAAVQGARLIVTAIEATDTVLREHHFEEKTTEVLIMDLAMPRVVDVSVDDLPGVERRDISHLGVIVNKTLADRHTLVDEALGIVEQEVEKFHHDMRSRGAAAIVMELRDHLEMLREKEVERRLADLSDLSEEQRERVVSLTRSLVAKIAHAPTLALKDASGTDRGQRLSEATRNLFDL
jgi:glutamyl-tRNA reductase